MSFPLEFKEFNTGDNSDQLFASYDHFLPPDALHSRYGQFFFALSSPDVRLGEQLHELMMDAIETRYYQDVSLDSFTGFEETLQAINEGARELFAGREGELRNLNMALAVISEQTLHLSQSGSGSIYLLRGSSLSLISEGLGPDEAEDVPSKVFYNISSGTLNQGDMVVLASGNLLAALDEHSFVRSLQKKNLAFLPAEVTTLDYLALSVIHVGTLEARVSRPETRGYTGARSTEPGASESRWGSLVKKTMGAILGHGRKPEESSETIDLSREKSSLPTPDSQLQASKFQNTWSIFKDNTVKSLDRLFNRRKGVLMHRDNRKKVIWGVLIVVLLIGAGWWGLKIRAQSKLRQSYEQTLQTIQDDYNTAETRAIYDKDGAKRLLVQMNTQADKIIAESNDPALIEAAKQQETKIQKLLDQVDNIFRLDNPKLAFDLQPKRPDIQAVGLFYYKNLYAFDYNALYKLILDSVDMRKISVAENDSLRVKIATTFDQEASVVFYTEDKQLIQLKDDAFTLVAPPEGGWKDATAIADYDKRRFLYFLSPAENQIWRYSKTNNGYEAPAKKNLANQDFSKGVSMAIDGAIYVLTSDGQVVKNYADEARDFVFDGLTQPLNHPTKILADTNQENGYLYILDPLNKRVVVTTKSGQYKAQFIFNQLDDLVDLHVVEEDSKLFVITKTGKVYEEDMKFS